MKKVQSSPILVYRRDKEIRQEQTDAIERKELAQRIVDSFNELGIGNISNINELKQAYSDPQKFYRIKVEDFIYQKYSSAYPGIKKSALVDMLDLDLSDPGDFYSQASRLNKRHAHLYASDDSIVITAGSQVDINENWLSELERRHSCFAESSDEIELYEALKGVISSLDSLHELSKKLCLEARVFVGPYKDEINLGFFDRKNEALEIKPYFFYNAKKQIQKLQS